MRYWILAGVAAIALVGRAEAQQPPVGPGWDRQSAAYLAGPPITRKAQLHATWSGMTQWGRTVYFATDDGRQGVMWQVNPAAPWMYKVSDGESGSLAADDFGDNEYAQVPAFAPAPRQAPAQPNGMLQAAYPPAPAAGSFTVPAQPQYQPAQAQQAAIALRFFGMALCAASGRC